MIYGCSPWLMARVISSTHIDQYREIIAAYFRVWLEHGLHPLAGVRARWLPCSHTGVARASSPIGS